MSTDPISLHRELTAREVDVMSLSIALGASIHGDPLEDDRDEIFIRLVAAFDRLRENPDGNNDED